ncbi:hypothetical protein Rhopal_003745-T1 [Rhodotorula paludigena]|uniref:Glycosyl transferase CAP10 domain-containing protein n=1 Tax=Rhodotorula paludigena TaxID=86838 RepID=A0AAV5GMH7_9BASI|nr:hypothetical protein Rhopal_003745-T1 [Rhodotorula paludigena]
MQQRQSFRAVPNTPNFTLANPDAPFRDLANPSPDPLPAASGSAAAPTTPPASAERASSHDYFASAGTSASSGEKYPPGRQANGHTANSSVHLPLLGMDDDADAPFAGLPRASAARRRRSASVAGLGGFLHSRARLHPVALLPAFFVGILVAMTGVLGPGWRSAPQTSMVIAPTSHAPAHDRTGRNYTLHNNGHLYVLPSALHPSSDSSPYSALEASRLLPHTMQHPIYDLIENATERWQKKLSRQSKTLEQAVREYKRRHGRKPPKGFDDWFRFAKANDVILIDEFDKTYTDILPFWALTPKLIASRSARLQVDPSTFTMVIQGGEVAITGEHAKDGRAKDQAALMKRWVKWVPDVNVTMSAHDGPSIMMNHEVLQKHVELGKKGKLLSDDEADDVGEDAGLWGFPLACPPNSRLRRWYEGLETDTLPRGPSYISDHLQTMNMCENPEWQYLHGKSLSSRELRPLFSFAKTTMHSDILLTPLEQYWDQEPWDPEWEKKAHSQAVWRGSTTGVWFDRGTWWRSSQRVRIWFMGKDQTGSSRVRFSGEGLETPQGVPSLVEKNVSTRALMQKYVDFAFTGREGQCDEEDGSCEAVRQLFDFQRQFGWNEANEYKFLLDLDGNAWSGRFHRLLSSNSAVLKSTIFPEWYADWIEPWVHYIPLKVDYTDLFDIMAFFTGDLDGRNAHDALAKQIADNGKDYATRFWRYADMEASPDRSKMDYNGPGA